MTRNNEMRGSARKLNPFLIPLIIVIIVMIGLFAANDFIHGLISPGFSHSYLVMLNNDLNYVASNINPDDYEVPQLKHLVYAKGGVGSEMFSNMFDDGALIMLIDPEGNIIDQYSMQSSPLGDLSRVDIVAAKYNSDRKVKIYSDRLLRYESNISTRPAIMLDGDGKELAFYRLILADESIGQTSAHFSDYFFEVDESDYNDMYAKSAAEYYGNADSEYPCPITKDYIDQCYAQTKDYAEYLNNLKLLNAQEYLEKEEEYLKKAGGNYMMIAPVWYSGYNVVLIYKSSNAGIADRVLNDTALNTMHVQFYTAALLCMPLIIILLAMWVFTDAKRRNNRPALWGTLTLIGNVVTLIVYLIVRPDARQCPKCHTPVKPVYIVCPMCGYPLQDKCACCGKPISSGWNVCPYCSTPIAGASDPAANALPQPKSE